MCFIAHSMYFVHLSPPLSPVVPGRFMPAGMGFGGVEFGGMGGGGEGGNRLGGKEAAVDSGVQQQAIQMREAGQKIKYYNFYPSHPHTHTHTHAHHTHTHTHTQLVVLPSDVPRLPPLTHGTLLTPSHTTDHPLLRSSPHEHYSHSVAVTVCRRVVG